MNKRLIKYILTDFSRQLKYVLGGSLVMILWMTLIDSDRTLSEGFKQFPMFMTMMLTIALLVYGMNNYAIHLQNHIAYGSTRINAVITVFSIEFLLFIVTYALIILATRGDKAAIYLAISLFGMGAGILLGMLVIVFSRKGYYAFIFACVIVGAMTGYVLNGINIPFGYNTFARYVLTAAVVFLAVNMAGLFLVTKRMSVKM